MREILFKAKRIDNGEWVEGFYRQFPIIKSCGKCLDHINHFIDDKNGESHFVDPATVGQYTGLTDKNGVKIWEGDVLRGKEGIFEIAWDSYYAAKFTAKKTDEQLGVDIYQASTGEYEVIGSIHDRKEPNNDRNPNL